MQFSSSPRNTVGVEWELQLLDPESLDLSDGIVPLMEFFPAAEYVKPEFIQSCVELNSCVADNSDAAVGHLQATLTKLVQRCTELGMGLCGAGTHPSSRRLALITPLPRYKRMLDFGGYLAYTQITFSTHVHVGLSSGDEAMRAMSRLIPVMPALLALSANSPFWRGHDTGYAAYRHRILAAAPTYGLPTRFPDWATFDEFLAAAKKASMIETFKDIHWDMRPHLDFGTLEVRVMDSASDVKTLHGLVAFARCLVLRAAHAAEEEIASVFPPELPYWCEKQNRFRASLRGLDAEYIVNADGTYRPMRDVITDLLDFCEPIAADIGEATGLRIAREVLQGKPAYEKQLDAYKRDDTARSIVQMLQQSLFSVTAGVD